MATKVLLPGSDSAVTWGANPAGSNYLNVSDDSADGTYNSTLAPAVDLFTLVHPGLNMRAVSQVDLLVRARVLNGGTATLRGVTKLGATTTTTAGSALTGSWADYSWSSHARPGGGSWVPADFASLLYGYETTAQTDEVQVSYAKVTLTHTEYEVAPPLAGRALGDTVVLPADPVRFMLPLTLVDPDDVAWVDDDAAHWLTFGPITVPGINVPLYFTQSRAAVVNPPTY